MNHTNTAKFGWGPNNELYIEGQCRHENNNNNNDFIFIKQHARLMNSQVSPYYFMPEVSSTTFCHL